MGSLSPYVRLFRIEHALLLCVAVLLAILISSKSLVLPLPPLPIIALALAVPLFIEMASFALNDYSDVATDRANGRNDRPIASGEISPKTALAASAVFYALGIAAAVPLAPAALAIAVVFAAISIAYDWKLKDFPLLGNACIAASMAIPFLFGNLVLSGILLPSLASIAAVAFVSGLGREIIKSAEDVEGDVLHRKSRTLPALIGKKNSALAAAALYLLLVPLSFLPFAQGLRANTLATGMVALTALAFAFLAFSVAKDQAKGNLEAARKSSLLALGVGLLGYAATLL